MQKQHPILNDLITNKTYCPGVMFFFITPGRFYATRKLQYQIDGKDYSSQNRFLFRYCPDKLGVVEMVLTRKIRN